MPKPKASRPHMPGYGLAEAKGGRGLLPWKWAKERLEKGRTYFISTSDPTGKPHVMPIWGIWLNDVFLFSTGGQSRKARNLSTNPRCSIVTDMDFKGRPKKNDVKDTIIIEGVANIVDDPRVRKKFSTLYEDKYAWDMEGFAEPIYRVKPNVVFGFASEFTKTATRWKFDEHAEKP